MCYVTIVDDATNYDGEDIGLLNGVQTVTRGCANRLTSDVAETELRQRRWIGCNSGDGCNEWILPVDPEDLGPLPRPGDWHRPLAPNEIALFCGKMGEDCKACYSCGVVVDNDPYGACQTNSADLQVDVYRNRYFDRRANKWLNNLCSVVAGRFFRLKTAPAQFVTRRVYQASDEEIENQTELEMESDFIMNYCYSDLCNGGANETIEPSNGVTRCFYCRASSEDPTNPCWTGIFWSTSDMIDCPTNVCVDQTNTNKVERGCLENRNTAAILLASGAVDQITSVAFTTTEYACDRNYCNDKYVTESGNILAENPLFEPQLIPMPVVNLSNCNDPNEQGNDTSLCIQCYTCMNIVDSFSDPEDVDFNRCIVELSDSDKQYYFKSDSGFPSRCALMVETTVSSVGYKYFIQRGAMSQVDPSIINQIGDTKIMTYRRGLFTCRDQYCNGHSFDQMPMPPIIDPRLQSPLSCFNCSYHANPLLGDNADCFINPPQSSVQHCSVEDNMCTIDFSEQTSVYDGNRMEIDRGCSYDANGELSTFTLRQIDSWVCSGDSCNHHSNHQNLPPYDPIEADTDRWTKPLSVQEANLLCAWSECIECFTCTQLFDVNSDYPEQYECILSSYRFSFINDRDTTELLYNTCATRSGLRENGESQVRFVEHGTVVSADGMASEGTTLSLATISLSTALNQNCKSCFGNCDETSTEVLCTKEVTNLRLTLPLLDQPVLGMSGRGYKRRSRQ